MQAAQEVGYKVPDSVLLREGDKDTELFIINLSGINELLVSRNPPSFKPRGVWKKAILVTGGWRDLQLVEMKDGQAIFRLI